MAQGCRARRRGGQNLQVAHRQSRGRVRAHRLGGKGHHGATSLTDGSPPADPRKRFEDLVAGAPSPGQQQPRVGVELVGEDVQHGGDVLARVLPVGAAAVRPTSFHVWGNSVTPALANTASRSVGTSPARSRATKPTFDRIASSMAAHCSVVVRPWPGVADSGAQPIEAVSRPAEIAAASMGRSPATTTRSASATRWAAARCTAS